MKVSPVEIRKTVSRRARSFVEPLVVFWIWKYFTAGALAGVRNSLKLHFPMVSYMTSKFAQVSKSETKLCWVTVCVSRTNMWNLQFVFCDFIVPNVFQIGLIPNDCITQTVFSCWFDTQIRNSLHTKSRQSRHLIAIAGGKPRLEHFCDKKLMTAFETEPVQYTSLLLFFVSLMLSFWTLMLSAP